MNTYQFGRALALGALIVCAASGCTDSGTAPLGEVTTDPRFAGNPEGVWESSEVYTGYITGRSGSFVQIGYRVRENGIAFIEGDILLGRADRIPSSRPAVMPRGGPRAAIVQLSGTWEQGIVPYKLGPGVDPLWVQEAIRRIESKTTGVDYVAYNPQLHRNGYLYLVAEGRCGSYIGWKGGEQKVEVKGCTKIGSISHELLHAIGLLHEQSRCDRDTYLTMYRQNISDDDWEANYVARCDGHRDVGPYYPGSIMHYSAVINGVRVMQSKFGWDGYMGQRDSLTRSDVLGVHALYPARIGVHRLYHAGIPDHFYTTTAGEGTQAGWRPEADNYFYLASVSGAGYQSLYRCYVSGRHYVSLDLYCEANVRAEGELGRVATGQVPGTRPLYRLVHPTTRDRLTTWDAAERDRAIQMWGYRFERVTGYAWVRSQ